MLELKLLNSRTPARALKKAQIARKKLIIPFRDRKFPLGNFKFVNGILHPVPGKRTGSKPASRADPRTFPNRNTLRT